MEFLKRKSVIIAICVLVSTLIFSIFSLMVINIFKNQKDKRQNELTVEAAYTFNDRSVDNDEYFKSTSNSNYKNNDTFYITTAKGLFCFSVSVAYGCSFSGKTIYLSNDINWNDLGWNFPPIGASMTGTKFNGLGSGGIFEGTFDGQSYTISNLHTTIEDSPWNISFYVGFVSQADNAIIRNLKLKNYRIYLKEDDGYANVGAILGHDTGFKLCDIENCIVEDFKIETVITDSYYSGIVGAGGNPQMKNIILKNFSVSGTGKDSSNINAFKYGACECDNAVIINAEGDEPLSHELENPWDSESKQFKTDNTIHSSEGGTSGTDWYYASEYNDGYPYLRQFMKDWSTVSFSEGTGGKVDKASIQIPSDAYKNFGTYFSGFVETTPVYPQTTAISTVTLTANPIEIYGQQTYATALAGYVFSGWTVTITRNVTWRWIEGVQPMPMAAVLPPIGSGRWYPSYGAISSVKCQARFTEETYNISFANVTLDSYFKEPDKTSITAKYNQSVFVAISHSATKTVITYTIGSEKIEYTIDAKYTIKSFGAIDKTTITKDTSIKVPNLTQGLTYTITPTIQLRQHNSEFN